MSGLPIARAAEPIPCPDGPTCRVVRIGPVLGPAHRVCVRPLEEHSAVGPGRSDDRASRILG
jgi:hypothetical protein